jgi:hypothetical protein
MKKKTIICQNLKFLSGSKKKSNLNKTYKPSELESKEGNNEEEAPENRKGDERNPEDPDFGRVHSALHAALQTGAHEIFAPRQ